jgi:hypothetical protein
MSYIPNAEDPTQPVASVVAGFAAAEFRGIKQYMRDFLRATLLSQGELITAQAAQITALQAAVAAASRAAFTGKPDFCAGTVAPAGTVLAIGNTIGAAASGATERANADTQALYELLWALTLDNAAPYTIQNSAGVATTRGATAALDFAANKRMPLPDLRDSAIYGVGLEGALLQKQQDQLQGFKVNIPAAPANSSGSGNYNEKFQRGFDNPGPAPDVRSTSFVTDGVNGTPRIGTHTRAANVRFTPIIFL